MTVVVWLPPGDEEAGGTTQGDGDVFLDINQMLKYWGVPVVVECKISIGE